MTYDGETRTSEVNETPRGPKPIDLTDEQKQYIVERFVHGETLLDKVVEFEEHEYYTSLWFKPASNGIAVTLSHVKDLYWVDALPNAVFVDFKKEAK